MSAATSYVVFGRTGPETGWQTWHHVAGRLAGRGRVVFVRDPVYPAGAATRTLAGVPHVVPADWPLQRISLLRQACARAGARRVRRTLAADGAVVAIVYPRADLRLVRALQPDLVVYHATDDYHLLGSGQPDAPFQEWEAGAVSVADLVLAVSTPLRDRLAATTETVVHLPNGYDERLFHGTGSAPPPEFEGLSRPIVGFAGTLNAERLDLPLLTEAATALPEFSFVFLGHVVDPKGALAPLRSAGNVHFHPARPIDEVAAFVGAFDVALVPYLDSPANRGAFPLKILEALAAGRPVVYGPGHPDLEGFRPHARVAANASECVRLLREMVRETGVTAADRRAVVADLTWGKVVARLEAEVGRRLDSGITSAPE